MRKGGRTKVSKQGNVVEVTVLSGCNTECHAVRLDKAHWIDPKTGEIHDYKNAGETRLDNMQELRHSFAKMRALINANCTKTGNLLWVTLTYAENMTDTRRLYEDFQRFIKRFRRAWGTCEYIYVPEPQKRGAWHIHLILIFPGRAPFVPNENMREMWGQGFVKVNSLRDVDNVGAYLSAYLGDLEVEPGEDVAGGADVREKVTKDGTTKRFIKGGRLDLYPVGMNLYRCSRGVKRPEEYWVETADQVGELEHLHEHYDEHVRHYTATLDNGRTIEVTKLYYNLLRPLGTDWHHPRRPIE